MSGQAQVRGADPATLFRSGGRTIGDIAREIEAPLHIAPERRLEWQMDVLFGGTRSAASRHQHARRSASR